VSRQFAVIPEVATFDARVTPAMYRMLGALGSYANRDGWVWTELSTLAERLKQTEGAVSKMIRKLIDAGYVEMHYETRKGRRCCVYRILYDRPAETAAAISDDELAGVAEGSGSHPPLSSTESLDENDRPSPLDLKESQGPARVSSTATQRPERQVSTFLQKESVFLERGTTSPPPPAAPARWQGLLARAQSLSTADPANALCDALRRMAALGDHRANALAAELEAIESGMHGPAATLEVIAQALHEMAVAGAEIRPALIRAFVRRVRDGEPTPRSASGPRGGPAPGDSVTVGSQVFSRADFWQLCVKHGLTAQRQGREALAARVHRLHEAGAVQDEAAFTALVLHVQPWTLVEIAFERAREERLAAALASWRPGRAA
jgi:hypothetical protein